MTLPNINSERVWRRINQKWRKANVANVMPVRPSVRFPASKIVGFYWKDFHENLYFRSFSWKSVGEIQVWLNSDETNGHLTQRPMYWCMWDNMSLNFIKMRNVSDKLVEKIKTHILCSRKLIQENHAVVQVMLVSLGLCLPSVTCV